eukprot:3065420-Amphidinium_carterae.1
MHAGKSVPEQKTKEQGRHRKAVLRWSLMDRTLRALKVPNASPGNQTGMYKMKQNEFPVIAWEAKTLN